MRLHTRKDFLQYAGGFVAVSLTGQWQVTTKQPGRLCFSTLGCPDWTFQQIIDFAAAHGYQGIEMRGIQRELDLTKCKEFTNENIPATLKRLSEKGLKLTDLGSSCNLHIADPVKRKENLEEAKRFITLAEQVKCPYVRVFPNNLPKDADKQATMALITAGLRELGDYANGTSVTVLMETHGDLVYMNDLVSIMKAVDHPKTGLVWDIANMWTITKEPPAQVYAALKKWIHHAHIKDAKLVNGAVEYVFLGKGEVPIFDAIDLLQTNGYNGYYSFEWEKMWHPEIAAPELALADYPIAMKQHWK